MLKKNEDILKENGGKKFDIVLMNPPYDRSMHLKFLEKVTKISNNIISIQPLTWLQDIYASENKNSNFNKVKNLGISNIDFCGKLSDLFTSTNHATYDIGIITIDNKKTIDLSEELNKHIELYPGQLIDSDLIKEIKEKMIAYCKEGNSVEAHIKSGKIDENTNYCIVIPRLVGNPGEKIDRLFWKKSLRWGRIFYKGKSEGKSVSEYKKKLSNVTNYSNFDYLEFKTEEEANNWIDSQSTDFNRFCMIICSVDSHRHCKYVPFMDYSKKWTNKDFYKYFNISEKSQEKIHKYIELFDKKFPGLAKNDK